MLGIACRVCFSLLHLAKERTSASREFCSRERKKGLVRPCSEQWKCPINNRPMHGSTRIPMCSIGPPNATNTYTYLAMSSRVDC